MKGKRYIPLKKIQSIRLTEILKNMSSYYCIFATSMIWGFDDIQLKQMVFVFILLINLIWIYVSSTSYPNCLTKELFLCPMTLRERKRYLLRHYWDKTIKNMLIFLIGSTLMVVMGWMNRLGAGLLFMSQLLMNLTAHLHLDIGKIQQQSKKKMKDLKGYSVSRAIMLFVGIFTWSIIAEYAIWDGWEFNLIICILMSIQVIASLTFIGVYSKPLFECGINSELVYLQQGTKEGVKKTR